MELKTFIADTLVQIVEGVSDAADRLSGQDNAYVNPLVLAQGHTDPKPVEFDVAVTVQDKMAGGGKAGLKVMAIEVGGGGMEKSTEAVSRIRFAVPVSLPAKRPREAGTKPLQYHPSDVV